MKRYTPHTLPCVTPDNYTEMRKDPEGEWVKWNDPLVQAAPYMLEALERIKESGVWLGVIPQEMMEASIAIAKETGE
jgi:hypothetical protein